MSDERIPLDVADPAAIRKRLRLSVIGVLVIAAGFGGLVAFVGVFIGYDSLTAGLITALLIAVPLILLSISQARRRTWLQGRSVYLRTFGTRSVDLGKATRLELFVMDLRGVRTVSLLIGEESKRGAINLPVASYSGAGGRELSILVLRKLADGLASNENPAGVVFAELLVAQLRAEAREEGLEGRPLYRLASSAPSGKLAVRLKADAVTKFVASLD